MSDSDSEHPTTEKPVITLHVVYAAIMDLRSDLFDALEEQAREIREAQSTLFQRGDHHKNRLDDHEAQLEALKTRVTQLERHQTIVPEPNGTDG